MKICGNTLEGVFLRKNGDFGKGTQTYVYVEKCKKCEEPYLTLKNRSSEYCSLNCSCSGENNGFYGKSHSEKTRKRISETQTKDGKNAGENNGFYGKSHSEEKKEQGRRERKGIARVKGEDHYRYNPNISDEEREEKRKIKGLREWRNRIFERDNGTCQICKERSQKDKRITLNAHHIEDYKNNRNLRDDDDNGITLCEECHIKFHKRFGFGNNTKEQFDKFVNEEAIKYE